MKKFISLILALMMCISLTSCVTTAYAQTDDEVSDVNVVITYGTPYYNSNGLLLYYIYRDLYYYPYYYNNRWHFRHYTRPLPPRHYRPIPRNFYHHRPNITHHRPNIGHNRLQTRPSGGTIHRPQGGINHGGGRHFGGRR
jgi:hypothetical protein